MLEACFSIQSLQVLALAEIHAQEGLDERWRGRGETHRLDSLHLLQEWLA